MFITDACSLSTSALACSSTGQTDRPWVCPSDASLLEGQDVEEHVRRVGSQLADVVDESGGDAQVALMGADGCLAGQITCNPETVHRQAAGKCIVVPSRCRYRPVAGNRIRFRTRTSHHRQTSPVRGIIESGAPRRSIVESVGAPYAVRGVRRHEAPGTSAWSETAPGIGQYALHPRIRQRHASAHDGPTVLDVEAVP